METKKQKQPKPLRVWRSKCHHGRMAELHSPGPVVRVFGPDEQTWRPTDPTAPDSVTFQCHQCANYFRLTRDDVGKEWNECVDRTRAGKPVAKRTRELDPEGRRPRFWWVVVCDGVVLGVFKRWKRADEWAAAGSDGASVREVPFDPPVGIR
ncbi:MAG: hypothetical protein GY749_08830 [Desulfobacteraceae bacterium]|nr:hypothetical protein [Desulfobacteraceae bacterium]